MIIILALQFFLNAVNIVFDLLNIPVVTVLPFGIDGALSTVFSTWNAFLIVFWPLQIVWVAMLSYYGFLVTLLLLKVFLGSRAPGH